MLVVLLFAVMSSLVLISMLGWNEEALRWVIRGSARLATLLFCLAFGISSFHRFFPSNGSHWLLRRRPYWGLSFAVFHTIHLLSLFVLQQSFHEVFTLAKTTSLLGGGMAYVLMYLMVITTFSWGRRQLSVRNWKLLHLIGGYWIWFIMFRSYFRGVVEFGEKYTMFSLVVIAFLFRMFNWILRGN